MCKGFGKQRTALSGTSSQSLQLGPTVSQKSSKTQMRRRGRWAPGVPWQKQKWPDAGPLMPGTSRVTWGRVGPPSFRFLSCKSQVTTPTPGCDKMSLVTQEACSLAHNRCSAKFHGLFSPGEPKQQILPLSSLFASPFSPVFLFPLSFNL